MMIETTATDVRTAGARVRYSPPGAVRVLAVTARPGQESADLGGLVYAFRRSGATLSLLCLTRGESTGQDSRARLEATRPWEVQVAAMVLGVGQVAVASYRDGNLHHYSMPDVAERIQRAIRQYSADLVLVVAPETGDIGDAAVARAATAAALRAGVPAAARTRPGVFGAWTVDLGADAEAARAIQRSAAAAHATQTETLPLLIDRVDQLGSEETLRWLVAPARVPTPRVPTPRSGDEH